MGNSPLVCYTKLSPCCSPRTHAIDTVTVHCMAGNGSVEGCGALFARRETGASANYGIGSDGRIALYVPEDLRSWCSSNRSNDDRAVTVEVANDGGAPLWHVSDRAIESLIALLADVCLRNGIPELRWKGDKSLIGQVDRQNMTLHRWFANKACPGDYLYNRHGEIAAAVNRRLAALRAGGEEAGAAETETSERDGEEMDIEKLIERMTPEQAAALFGKAQGHFAAAALPDWAKAEFEQARALHITDGSAPMAFVTRAEAALMAVRAASLGGAA